MLLPAARHALTSLADGLASAREVGRGKAGRLRIGFAASLALTVLPGLLRTFRERFPRRAAGHPGNDTTPQLTTPARPDHRHRPAARATCPRRGTRLRDPADRTVRGRPAVRAPLRNPTNRPSGAVGGLSLRAPAPRCRPATVRPDHQPVHRGRFHAPGGSACRGMADGLRPGGNRPGHVTGPREHPRYAPKRRCLPQDRAQHRSRASRRRLAQEGLKPAGPTPRCNS